MFFYTDYRILIFLNKFQLHSPALPIPEPAMEEGASKWNHSTNKAPTEVYQFQSFDRHVKKGQQRIAKMSVASSSSSALEIELVRVRSRVKELETERFFFNKKLKHLLRKLSEEKASWMRIEQQKMNAVIKELKDELRREKRNRQKMDIINSKLSSDLADAKLSARQLIDDFQTERKDRELLEDICNELVKEIESSKAALKSMETECTRIQDEVEEERKMLQMAEVWREERVQMKLIDAKLILEQKYYQMNSLIGDLETFLSSRGATNLDTTKMNEAMGIVQSLDSFNVVDIEEELHYTPPKSYDIYTIMEDIRNSGTNESEIDQCLRPSPASHSSDVQNVNPQPNEQSSNVDFIKEFANHGSDDEQSSYSFSDFINGNGEEDRHMSSFVVTGHDQNENQEPLSSSDHQQFRGKGSSFHKLSKSPVSSDGNQKRVSRTIDSSSIDVSVAGREVVNQQEILTQWSTHSQGQRNPHISRAMKGCIEWPRGNGIQRYGSKTKLLEVSLESQKTQVRNTLKQRIR